MTHPRPPSTPIPTPAAIVCSVVLLAMGLCGGAAGAATPVASAAATSSSQAALPSAAKPVCESQEPGYDSRLIQCPITTSATPQRLRFKVNFSGGHDDTMASMTTSLDDTPLACDKASKTRLMGEDGDVSLDCGFVAVGKPGTQQVLRVKATWSHAQYVGFEMTPD